MAKKKEEKIRIGDRFGKLEVVDTHIGIPQMRRIKNKHGETIFEETGKMHKAWKCKCDCGNYCVEKESVLLRTNVSLIRSCGCSKEPNPNYIPTKLTAEEVKQWDDLYEYVRSNIMDYPNDVPLSQQMVTRLKGLLNGKFIANNKSRDYANYSYELVLNTFKYCSLDIKRGLSTKDFNNNEWYKFLYVTKIVENNLNTVYIKMKNAKKTKEDAKNIDVSLVTDYVNKFKAKKNTSNKNGKYDAYW